jgi:hypothetical protein
MSSKLYQLVDIVKADTSLRPSLRILRLLFWFVYVVLLQSFSDIFIRFRVHSKLLKKRIVASSFSGPYKDISSAVNVMWNFINLFFNIRSFFDSFYFCMNQVYFKEPIIVHLSKILYGDFHETLNFLLVPTTARHCSVSWAGWVSSLGLYIFTYFCNKKSMTLRELCYHNTPTNKEVKM